MKNYRVAIIGCGNRGKQAGLAYNAHPRTEVVGLCDVSKDRLHTISDELNVRSIFTNIDEMITATKPDIVAIPTGTEFHYDVAMQVLEHGVHIDIEKPLCSNLDEADKVLAKADKAMVKVAVHHQGRVGPSMKGVAKAVSEGKIGKIGYIQSNFEPKGYYGGFGLMNIGTHILNSIIKFSGHCQSIVALATAHGNLITPDDVLPGPLGMGTIAGEYITSSLQFDNDVSASYVDHRQGKFAAGGYSFEMLGSEGRIICEMSDAWWLPQTHYLPDGVYDRWERIPPIYPDHYDPKTGAIEDDYCFVDEYVAALDENRDHDCSGKEGLHVMEIMFGIFEAAMSGKRIDLPQENRDHPLLRWRKENGLGALPKMPRPWREWLAVEDKRLGRT